MTQQADSRLVSAIQHLTGGKSLLRRLDVRATIALLATLAILAMAWAGRAVPGELWLAYGAILGYFFPKPQDTTRE